MRKLQCCMFSFFPQMSFMYYLSYVVLLHCYSPVKHVSAGLHTYVMLYLGGGRSYYGCCSYCAACYVRWHVRQPQFLYLSLFIFLLCPGAVIKVACLESQIVGSSPALAFKFQRNKMFLPRSLMKIPYCVEPPRPRGSVLDLTQPELEFRIMCLEGSVISFISLSPGGSPVPV